MIGIYDNGLQTIYRKNSIPYLTYRYKKQIDEYYIDLTDQEQLLLSYVLTQPMYKHIHCIHDHNYHPLLISMYRTESKITCDYHHKTFIIYNPAENELDELDAYFAEDNNSDSEED